MKKIQARFYSLILLLVCIKLGDCSKQSLPLNLKQNGCSFNQIQSPLGCIKSCAILRYSICLKDVSRTEASDVCAYNKNKLWVNYPFICQACRNQNILGYIQGKCSCNQIGCGQCEKCVGKICQRDPSAKCQQCNYHQYRQNGKCIDKCNKIKCISGLICDKGQCIQQNKCKNIRCSNGYSCLDGKCVDNCATIRCMSGYVCQKGQCQKAVVKPQIKLVIEKIGLLDGKQLDISLSLIESFKREKIMSLGAIEIFKKIGITLFNSQQIEKFQKSSQKSVVSKMNQKQQNNNNRKNNYPPSQQFSADIKSQINEYLCGNVKCNKDQKCTGGRCASLSVSKNGNNKNGY